MFEEKPELGYDYVKAHCKVAKYLCLMPVEYKWDGAEYHKTRMQCRQAKAGTCKEYTTCAHFLAAPETPDPKTHLLNEPYK